MDIRVYYCCELAELKMELDALQDYYKRRKKELKRAIKDKEKQIYNNAQGG